MYNYGYGYGWDYGYGKDCCDRIHGTVDNCGIYEGGRVGCGWSTYHNDILYGSMKRPVRFIDLKKMCICDEEVNVLVPDMEFFERFKFDCKKGARFVGEICVCLPFGNTKNVFIATSPKCDRLLPLESSRNGFLISLDQIQPFTSGYCKLIMTNCYDGGKNDHITISNYYRGHSKCACDSKCDCDGRDGYDGFDGYKDGYID